MNLHYAHTSHGDQLVCGANIVESENPEFDTTREICNLPSSPDCLRVLDGMPAVGGRSCATYVTPELYWQTSDGMNWVREGLLAISTLTHLEIYQGMKIGEEEAANAFLNGLISVVVDTSSIAGATSLVYTFPSLV